jgi:hypothetical protein
LVVHGERDPATRKVEQRILFTIYSKAEAHEAIVDMGRAGGRFGALLERAHPGLRFDWKRLARDLRAQLHVLPDDYDVREERVRSRFRGALRAFARQLYWNDLETRPYMRGMRNLALALNRAGHWEEALAVCDRLEQECDDRITAMAHRSSVYLNTGRWAEAAGAAQYLRGIDPSVSSLVAALAFFEVGRQRAALASFLHGALNAPRAARMVLGFKDRTPRSSDEVRDHNTGIDLRRDLHTYLRGGRRPSLRFFARTVAVPEVAGLLREIEAVVVRWHEQHRTSEREAFKRMNLMHSLAFAEERAREIADSLGLPGEPPALPETRTRRKEAVPAPGVH